MSSPASRTDAGAIVFISYSQEGDAHNLRVRTFADSLKALGIQVILDQYEPDPPDGWTLWMDRGIKAATHVLLICTETYERRLQQTDPQDVSRGVRYEGKLIRSYIYDPEEGDTPAKFIPVLVEGGNPKYIPRTLRDRTRYEIKFFSVDDPAYLRLCAHLTGRDPAELAASGPRGSASGPRVLDFRVEASAAGGSLIRLSCEALGTAEDRFDGDPLHEQTTLQYLQTIAAGRDQEDDLRFVGAQLWGGLMAGKVGELFRKARRASYSDGRLIHLRLALTRDFETLPWEALYEPEGGFLATQERFCVIRFGAGDTDPALPWSATGRKPGILLVFPSGSGLDLSRERTAIARRAAPLGPAVRVEVLDGTVTLERLRDTLATRLWDVVHFGGHGRAEERGNVELLLNDDQGGPRWIGDEVFASLFNNARVRLVLLNCCRSATVRPERMATLGPILLRRGVAAVVAMRYEVTDADAQQFADEFYRALLSGTYPGRVDVAVESARVAVFQSQTSTGTSRRGFITPALYLAPGGEQLFPLDRPAPPAVVGSLPDTAAPGAVAAPAPAAAEIPPGLLKVFRERKCVPVLGPGLLSPAVRDTMTLPGPRLLARKLADASHYPERTDFDLLERAGEWLDGLLLRRVCQHFLSNDEIQHELFEMIDDTFGQCKPPPAVQTLAGWDVPGYVCLYIDGLLAQALRDRKRDFAALSLSSEAPSSRDLLRLVHVCGTWDRADDDDFTVSEQQHDQLWDKLAKPPPWLSDLVLGEKGRSLLVLGAHPRDPLTRRLVSKLLDPKVARRAGPVYFAYVGECDVDGSYWKTYKVHWIEAPALDVIAALEADRLAGGGGGP